MDVVDHADEEIYMMDYLLANLHQAVLLFLLHKLLLLLFLTRNRILIREIISLLHIDIHHSKWVSTVRIFTRTCYGAHRVNHGLYWRLITIIHFLSFLSSSLRKSVLTTTFFN